MNVGLFADCYWPTRSGVVTSMMQLRQGLEARGHRVVVGAAATGVGDSGSEPAVYLFPSLPFNDASRFRLAVLTPGSVARIAARERLDLVHTHTEFSVGWAAKAAARRLGLPLVHTGHTLYDAYRHYLPFGRHLPVALVHRYLRAFLADYDLLVCPSAKAWAYYVPLQPHLTAVVAGNGIDASRFRPVSMDREAGGRTRTKLGWAPSDRVILHVGRLGAEKRVLPLLDTLAPLLQACPGYKVLFVGDGPDRAALTARVAERDLEPQVQFVTDVPWTRMYRLYAAADLFATLSLSEVHPMTLIEAAVCGVPVVARRDRAYEGLVCDGYNGYLADADRDLATRAAQILEDEALRRIFSANALRVAVGLDAEQHAASIEALYCRLL